MSKALFNIAYTLPDAPKYMKGDKRAEYIAQRQFYNLTSKWNFLKYILRHEKSKKNKSAEEYFTINGTNSGLFDLNGKMSEKQIEKMKEELKNTKSIIWHGFITFDQETTLGLDTQEKAIHFMQQTFKSFLKDAHFDLDNVGIYCSLHTNKAHHNHIHFAFYEKQPKRRDKEGNLCFTKKGTINSNVLDNYLVSANMHLSENREDYYTARDRAMAKLREITKQPIRKQEANLAIDELRKQLPVKGRLQYNSENMAALRPQIDRVAALLIASNPEALLLDKEMRKQLDKAKQEVIDLVADNKLAYLNNKRLTKKDIKSLIGDNATRLPIQYVNLDNVKYFEKLQNDYKARVGNVVLGLCKRLNNKEYFNGWQKDRAKKIAAQNKQKRKDRFIEHAIKILTAVEQQENSNFIKSVQETIREQEIEKALGQNIQTNVQ